MRTAFIVMLIFFSLNSIGQTKASDTVNAMQLNVVAYKADTSDKNITKFYNSKGILVVAVPWKNGKRNGIAKKYYDDNGKLWQEIPYTNDMINGIVKKYYYKNGKLASETIYVMGIEGATKKWDETGKPIK